MVGGGVIEATAFRAAPQFTRILVRDRGGRFASAARNDVHWLPTGALIAERVADGLRGSAAITVLIVVRTSFGKETGRAFADRDVAA